jgi:hypothetical protein
MLAIKDINQNDLSKGELLEDKVNDYIKYFYSLNQFRDGKIVEILPHGTIIVKNKLNYTHDRISKMSLILNISLLERKLMNNFVNTSIINFNNDKETKLRDEICKLRKYMYIIGGISIASIFYVFKQIII